MFEEKKTAKQGMGSAVQVNSIQQIPHPEMIIYKRKRGSKKERKHALDQVIFKKNDNEQEKKEGNGKRKLELHI